MPNIWSSLFRFFSISILLFSLSCTATSFRKPATDFQTLPGLPLFAPLNDWLYRGAQPEEEGLKKLQEIGIRTVVNFRDEPGWVDWERRKVEALGMNYVSLSWSILGPVKPELLDQFFEVLDQRKNRPIFIHCEHGRDRTGVMTTLALMRYEKLPEKEARELALETYRPHFRFRWFVNQKINFFLREKASEFSKNT